MTNKFMLSIVTVVLNDVNLIERTILSVLTTKNSQVEYIVVDGGSTDGTMDIVNRYKDQIDIVISEPDNGLYDAMNKGIRRSSGLVVGLLNSGDYYEVGALTKLTKLMDKSGCNVIYYSDTFLAYSDLNTRRLMRANLARLNQYMSICHQAVFVPRLMYKKYGYYTLNYRFGSDFAFLLKLYLSNEAFQYCEMPLVTFSTGGLSDTKIFQSRIENIKILFQLNSPKRYVGSLRYCFEVFQMYGYRVIIYIAGAKIASILRTNLFHRKD
jgi:glycosyltransferase involved in cell wall biosynthesis